MPFPDINPTPEDSPLLFESEELIQRHNRLAATFRRLQESSPELLREHEELRRLDGELAAVHAKLTRKKFLVGFIGESGVGKSTAFNNVLDDVPKADRPAVPGAGGATTAAVMKLHADGQHSLTLQYMTPTEFNALRDFMCEAIGIQPGLYSDPNLLRALPARREEAMAGRGQQVPLKSIEMLEKLLRGRQRNSRLIQEPPLRTPTPYGERDRHINHQPGDEAPDNLLLDVAEIGLCTQRIGSALEMIDLPGLGQGARDTYLTRKFLAQLDGTLLFYSAENLTKHVGEEAFASLREVFEGRLEGRVWLIVTYFDSLAEEHLYGRRDIGVTVFDFLEQLLSDNRLRPAKVCFLSRKLFDSAQLAGGANDRAAARATLGIHSGDTVPPRLAQMDPALIAAFDELLRDGGISNLRTLITDRVANEVRKETRAWCERKLGDIKSGLIAALRGELKNLDLGNDWIIHVTRWKTTVRILLDLTLHRAPFFEEAAEDLRTTLEQSFLTVFPAKAALDTLEPKYLQDEFDIHARMLEGQLDAHTSTKTVPFIYGRFLEQMGELPEVEVLKCASPVSAWEGFRAKDIASNGWRGEHYFPTFHSKELFCDLNDDHVGRLNGRTYRTMMLDKIRVTSYAAVHALRMRVRQRLDELGQALGKLVGTSNGRAPLTADTGAQQIRELLDDLGEGSDE